MYTILHLKSSVGCRFLVFPHLRNLDPVQCKQVYKTEHKLDLAEISEDLAGNNVYAYLCTNSSGLVNVVLTNLC